MKIQFLKFFINGGILGVAAWGLQFSLYKLFGKNDLSLYALASAASYIPLALINFRIQRSLIFARDGAFLKFMLSNIIMMVFVSCLSSVCRVIIDILFYPPLGERFGYITASLIGSFPSFLLNKKWVFAEREGISRDEI